MSSTEFDVFEYLSELCQHIKALSHQSVLHPSKCYWLAESYSALLPNLRSLVSAFISSSSPFLPPKLSASLAFLAYILLEGKRFIKDCTLQDQGKLWLATKGLTIPFSTEISDVHLHDFVWCVSILIFCIHTVDTQDSRWLPVLVVSWECLMEIWALVDEEDDVKKMQVLFQEMGAKRPADEQICKLIHNRLSKVSESTTSKAKVNLISEVVPDYLWMDCQAFKDKNECVLGSNHSIVVFETSLMGGRFAFKHFHRNGYEEVFANEAVVQAGLQHANIVHLVCCSKRASTSGLVIELMDQDLCSFISKKREYASFSLLARLDLILQIAKGMQYLHGLGIMHRDLKSLNILVSCSKGPGNTRMNAKITDFGTAKVKHHTSMFTTKPIGTSIWRAPEIIDGEDDKKYTKKADVYSFAIVCCEILTGLPPEELFPLAKGGRKSLWKLLKEGIRPKLPSSCPTAIASYIGKCWDGDASKRPTFNQICMVFRVFKAGVFLREEKLLATPLQDDILASQEVLQRTAAERQSKGILYHPVIDILFRMQNLMCPQGEGELQHIINKASGSREVSSRLFTAEELKVATENYAEHMKLGMGGFGTVYKGVLPDSRLVAIKKANRAGHAEARTDEFLNEMRILMQINHRNIVRLLGCCMETAVPLLVYEFVGHGNVRENLDSGDPGFMCWAQRLKVARQTAEALAYLHAAASPPILHRDVKSANVLLDDNLDSKVADFGASRLVSDGIHHVSTAVQGTLGYLDPEYFQTLQLTDKSDVYSMGVMLVELITGLKPIDSQSREPGLANLALLFIKYMQEDRGEELLDCRLEDLATIPRGEAWDLSVVRSSIMAVADLALRCLALRGADRPSMNFLADELRYITRSLEEGDNELDARENSPLMPRKPKPSKHYEGGAVLKQDAEFFVQSAYSGLSINDLEVALLPR